MIHSVKMADHGTLQLHGELLRKQEKHDSYLQNSTTLV